MFKRSSETAIFAELNEDELLERESVGDGWLPQAQALDTDGPIGVAFDADDRRRADAVPLTDRSQRDRDHRVRSGKQAVADVRGLRRQPPRRAPDPGVLLLPDEIYPDSGLRGRAKRSLVRLLQSEPERRESAVDRRLAELAETGLRRGAVVAAVSPKGGSGKTTMALVLASTIARTLRWQPVVVDADFTGGTAALHVPARARREFTVVDAHAALKAGEVRGPAELARYLTALPGGAQLLPAPTDPHRLEQIDAETMSSLIEQLTRFYPIVILDNSPGVGIRDSVQRWTYEAATDLVVVAFPKRVDAVQAREAIAYLCATLPDTPMSVVLNQVPPRPDEPTRRVMAVPLSPDRSAHRVEVPYDDRLRRQLDRATFALDALARPTRIAFKELAATLAGAWV